MRKPIPELRYRELERLLELFCLIKETPEGGARKLNLEYRTMILADVNRSVVETFGSWEMFDDKNREQCELLLLTMLEMGVMPLRKYLKGIL